MYKKSYILLTNDKACRDAMSDLFLGTALTVADIVAFDARRIGMVNIHDLNIELRGPN